MKHPPKQMPDTEARNLIEEWIGNGKKENRSEKKEEVLRSA
jgi:hypothetical protein